MQTLSRNAWCGGGPSVWASLLVMVVFTLGMARAKAGTVTTVTYVYTNAQGSPLATANAQGTILARYTYRPYGTQQSGPTNAGPGYTGHVNDPDTGLVYMQQRYYDPVVGRFLSPDPIMPSPGNVFNIGRYTYARDNPIVNIDPTGTTCVLVKTEYSCKVDSNLAHFSKSEIKRINTAYTNAVNQLMSHPLRTATVNVKGVMFRVSAGDVAKALIKAKVLTGRGSPKSRAQTEGGYDPNAKPGQESWLQYNGHANTTIFHNALVKDRAGHYLADDIDHDLELTFGHEGIHETPNDSAMNVFGPKRFNSIHNSEYNRAGDFLINTHLPMLSY